MFRRPIDWNQRTALPDSTYRRPSVWFTNRTSTGAARFEPPVPVGVRDRDGDYLMTLADGDPLHSNPRFQGKNREIVQQVPTTIFY